VSLNDPHPGGALPHRPLPSTTGLARRLLAGRPDLAVALGASFVLAASPAALALAADSRPAVEVPALTGRVVDAADLLSAPARARVAALSEDLERRTTAQLAVLTVVTLRGESIEAYALRVANTWKLGRKGRDNGVLVLVVPQDRTMRIELGSGLERELPDGVAARIIRELMAPAFRQGDFDGGIERGVRAVVAELQRSSAAAPP